MSQNVSHSSVILSTTLWHHDMIITTNQTLKTAEVGIYRRRVATMHIWRVWQNVIWKLIYVGYMSSFYLAYDTNWRCHVAINSQTRLWALQSRYYASMQHLFRVNNGLARLGALSTKHNTSFTRERKHSNLPRRLDDKHLTDRVLMHLWQQLSSELITILNDNIRVLGQW